MMKSQAEKRGVGWATSFRWVIKETPSKRAFLFSTSPFWRVFGQENPRDYREGRGVFNYCCRGTTRQIDGCRGKKKKEEAPA